MYNLIFFTNVCRILTERKLSKLDLSRMSGVSISFLSDLTTGKANPSLKVMEDVANALDLPLPHLLETTDLDPATLVALEKEGRAMKASLPPPLRRVSVILPEHRAIIVEAWAEETRQKWGGGVGVKIWPPRLRKRRIRHE
jgi:transcriptional regulator with XRE-family HTH domain